MPSAAALGSGAAAVVAPGAVLASGVFVQPAMTTEINTGKKRQANLRIPLRRHLKVQFTNQLRYIT